MKKIAQTCCLTLLTYCFSLGMACAQNYLPPTVKDALCSGELSSSQMAASVVPLNGGALRLSWRDHVRVTPASTEKMVTTLAALELLGPDWRWKTAFSYEGSIVNGVLHGTLFIKGGGDPKYVSENLWRDLSRLKSLGIDGIDGDVVIDRSYFEKDRQDPEFEEDWDRPYTAAADAALFNYSSIALTISPQKNEQKALVTVSPQVPGLIVPKTVPISNQKGCVRWRQALELDTDNPWRPDFEGALPSGCEEKVLSYLVSDANGYWQAYLRTLSSQVGLIWQGKVREGRVPPQAVGLFDVWSDDLGSLVKLTNKFSNNVFAKHILLTLAAKDNPDIPADYHRARSILNAWLQYSVQSPSGEISVVNGSGLSRQSRVTARAMTKLIAYGWKSPRMPEWISSFPISAMDGTMSKRQVAPGCAYIKTGLMNNVKSAGGMIQAKSGKRYAVFAAVEGRNATKTDAPIDRLIEWVYFNG